MFFFIRASGVQSEASENEIVEWNKPIHPPHTKKKLGQSPQQPIIMLNYNISLQFIIYSCLIIQSNCHILIVTIFVQMSTNNTTFTQCFWHANGQIQCEKTVVSTLPYQQPPAAEYMTFAKSFPHYNPNAYLEHVDWYNSYNQSSCPVPCKMENSTTTSAWNPFSAQPVAPTRRL